MENGLDASGGTLEARGLSSNAWWAVSYQARVAANQENGPKMMAERGDEGGRRTGGVKFEIFLEVGVT